VGARAELLPRILIALVAALALVWFVVLVRDQHLGSAASHRILNQPRMSQAAWDDTRRQLREAELLDPSTDWRMLGANYLLQRDRRAALADAEYVIRREPDNLEAWFAVLKATEGHQPRLAAKARAEIRRLNPAPARDE
jgi:hypothetical protein